MNDHHGHGHGHDDDRPLGDRIAALTSRRALLAAVLTVLVATAIGLLAFWPTGEIGAVTDFDGETFFGERVEATVDSAALADCSFSPTPGQYTCNQIAFEVTSGTPAGRTGTLELPVDGVAAGARIATGDAVILSYSPNAPDEVAFQFSDFQRDRPMALLAFLFAASVVALGRWRGAFALAGAVVSFLVLVAFALPALLDGGPPVLIALIATCAVAIPALYLAHGISERTTVALLGTVSSLLLTCVLGLAFVHLTHLTGLAGDEVGFLQAFGGDLDFAGLLLAGMVIGALGVLDDVTVTQVSAVWELRAADPSASAVELYRAGIRIGRDHVASTVNTLLLAYAGASLPLLLLFNVSGRGLGTVLTTETVAAEVVRALVGSIGIVACVPITTALAAAVVTARPGTAAHRPPGRPRTRR